MDPIDTTYYTWSTFFRALSGQATDTEMRAYIHTRSLLHESSDIARAEKHRDWLLAFSPTIRFLRDSISKLGGDLDSTNIRCIRCDTMSARGIRQGAFAGDMGIVLCANHLRDRKTTEDVLAHEMVHAYDYMRFKYDKWNLKHMACTEVCCASGVGAIVSTMRLTLATDSSKCTKWRM
jgi:inner membrane protease ATP23